MRKTTSVVAFALATGLTAPGATAQDPMATGLNGYTVSAPLLTIGQTLSGTTGALNPNSSGDYTPPGVLDGLGAYELDEDTVRVFANHELLSFRGYDYAVSDGMGGTFTMPGARVSYLDIDKDTRTIVDGGVAYERIYDANGDVASDNTFLTDGFDGFSRLCSSALIEAGEYGLVDTIYFTGEEDGGSFNPVGGAEWALDVANGDIWQLPDLGRGAWENVTLLDTGDPDTVAVLLADDSSPFDFDGKGEVEAAPLYLYLGVKEPSGNFLERNGLSGGQLHVWVSNTGERSPLDFNTSGSLTGTWVPVSNVKLPGLASELGETGYDEYGYPTQGTLWLQADALGAFGFSRPEDVATNPFDGTEAVLASTGVDTFAVDEVTGNGVDTFGTLYRVKTNFADLTARIEILYDGDADPTRALRSPDNLDWADDGIIYVQEDEAEEDTLSGDEVLWGPGAVNSNEAGIVRVDPGSGDILRVANIDRSVVLDFSIPTPTDAVDVDAGAAGEWETSGILDVSTLFDQEPGTLFLFDVQAHGIEDQDDFNPGSRINDGDLVEGGQLVFLEASDVGNAFVDLGDALGGTAGDPVLTGEGTLAPNSDVTLLLSNALPNSVSTLVIGFSELATPFKGGVFVPSPDILVSGLPTGGAGSIESQLVFPGGVLTGTEIYLQHWITDAGGPAGFAASNALRGTTP